MSFPHGHALLIGVGTHQYHAGLNVPITVADAKAVADVLQDSNYCGYPSKQVRVIHDGSATKAGILSALDELASQTTTDDTVFLFYCGHGALGTDGNYYLVSHDAKVQGRRVVANTGVSEGELLAKLKALAAQRVLLIFNACHSGNISPTLALEPESLDGSNPDEVSAMALLGTGQGRIFMIACREQQLSYIGKGPTTIFTKALIDGLQGKGVGNNHGFISAFSLYEHLYETVREIAQAEYNATQEPELTILKGVGPFAVSRFKGASTLGGFDESEPVPEAMAVREVRPLQSERIFAQRTVQTGGGAYIRGNVNTGGGDFVGRDKVVHGDDVRGDKVHGDKVRGDKVHGDRISAEIGDNARGIAVGKNIRQTHVDNAAGGINFGVVENKINLVRELEKLQTKVAQAIDAGLFTEEVATDVKYQVDKATQQAKKPEADKKSIVDYLTQAKTLIAGITAASGLVTACTQAIEVVQKFFK